MKYLFIGNNKIIELKEFNIDVPTFTTTLSNAIRKTFFNI